MRRFRLSLTVCLALIVIALIHPVQRVSADPGGYTPFLTINGSYTTLYPVSVSSLPYSQFNMPLYAAPDSYLLNQPLTFVLDSNLLPVSREDLPNALFHWDFGDGAKADGLQNTHTYTKIGSYILSIQLENAPHYTPLNFYDLSIPFNAVLINILPDKSYKLPKAVIAFNQQGVKDPLLDYVQLDFRQPLVFDATPSIAGSTPIVSYFWDFDDQTQSTLATGSHQFDNASGQVHPVLRVTDANGFISDTFIELDNNGYGSSAAALPALSQPSQPIDTTNSLVAASANFNDTIKRLMVSVFTNGSVDYRLLLVVLGFAFFAGSLHALTPGHGKSMMAAFLIGKGKSKLPDVFILAFSITFAHTAIIYVLGFLLIVLTKQDPGNAILQTVGKGSAIVVALLALSLIYRGWKNYRHAWAHYHEHEHAHRHSPEAAETTPDRPGSRYVQLFLAGASGGLTPCVDALALLLLAMSIKEIAFGLVIVFIFSLGLAGSILIIGLLVVFGRNLLNLEKRIGGFAEIYGPIIAGLFILFLSITIFLNYR